MNFMRKIISMTCMAGILAVAGCRGFDREQELQSNRETESEQAQTTSDIEPPKPVAEEQLTPDSEPTQDTQPDTETSSGMGQSRSLKSTEDIDLRNTDGVGEEYSFSYDGESFLAVYTPDNWKVVDSWRITVEEDITIICRALQNEHPIHGADGESYRTPEDMAFEWMQHNLAYELLPEDNPWRQNAKDVDLDPEDQGRTFDQMYEARTGRKFDPRDFLE